MVPGGYNTNDWVTNIFGHFWNIFYMRKFGFQEFSLKIIFNMRISLFSCYFWWFVLNQGHDLINSVLNSNIIDQKRCKVGAGWKHSTKNVQIIFQEELLFSPSSKFFNTHNRIDTSMLRCSCCLLFWSTCAAVYTLVHCWCIYTKKSDKQASWQWLFTKKDP